MSLTYISFYSRNYFNNISASHNSPPNKKSVLTIANTDYKSSSMS
nr:MAG TPA: hypothetical protein [Caudoviricetes sp.]